MLDQAQLVQDAVRLRRAHRRHPADEDLVAVRANLERAAGPTVGRAATARMLGVSQTALVQLRRWRDEGRIHPRYADRWAELLTGPRAQLLQVLRADDEPAATLRQSSPFAGMLDERERRALLGTGVRSS